MRGADMVLRLAGRSAYHALPLPARSLSFWHDGRRSSFWRWRIAEVAAVVLGFVAVCAPVFARPARMPSPCFPLVRTAVENLGWLAVGLLLASGLLLGAVFCRRAPGWRPLWLGALSMASFPALALIEMVADPTSHNLCPCEFAMYGGLTLPAMAGACIGRALARLAAPIATD